MVDDVGIGERREISAGPIRAPGAYETDWSGDDAGYQKFVVRHGRAPSGVGVDLDMLLLKACTTIIRSVTWLPLWQWRFGKVELACMIE